jgi:hypothetical protein
MLKMRSRLWSNINVQVLYLCGVCCIYAVLFVLLEGLQGQPWGDETSFWKTSLTFSQRLIPTLEQLRGYNELNTPLPFILFGTLEHLFEGGIFAGRLLNFVLSFAIVLWIGWPRRQRQWGAILSAVGLLLFPYYLWVSAHLYTDLIAAAWVLLGIYCYRRNWQIPCTLAFILGIASRQYMLAFPLGLAAFELVSTYQHKRRLSLKILAPIVAALSIVGWFILFQGLAPPSVFEERAAPAVQHSVWAIPEVQRSVWAITPGSGLLFMSFVGFYFVIPELILFWRGFSLRWQMKAAKYYRNYWLIASGLLILFILFPPSLVGTSGIFLKMTNLLPADGLKLLIYYALALLACWRFSRMELAGWLVLFNALIMMKAYQWDRYALPLLVVLWYLKSVRALDSPLADRDQRPARPASLNARA